jgi:hypothetical protein
LIVSPLNLTRPLAVVDHPFAARGFSGFWISPVPRCLFLTGTAAAGLGQSIGGAAVVVEFFNR